MRSLDFWLFLRQIRQNLLTLFTLFTSSPCFTFFQSFISQTCLTSIPCTRQYPKFCLPFLLLDLSPNLSHNSHVRSTRFGRRPENRADVCAARRCGVALQDDVRLRKVPVWPPRGAEADLLAGARAGGSELDLWAFNRFHIQRGRLGHQQWLRSVDLTRSFLLLYILSYFISGLIVYFSCYSQVCVKCIDRNMLLFYVKYFNYVDIDKLWSMSSDLCAE